MISTGGGIVALVIGSMAGYALARFRYQIGRIANDQISNLFLSQRLFPVAVLAVPFLILYRELSLLDTQCSRTRRSAWRSPALTRTLNWSKTSAHLTRNCRPMIYARSTRFRLA
jgi:ABC-type spermidine/putrescine transport system permease subunit II